MAAVLPEVYEDDIAQAVATLLKANLNTQIASMNGISGLDAITVEGEFINVLDDDRMPMLGRTVVRISCTPTSEFPAISGNVSRTEHRLSVRVYHGPGRHYTASDFALGGGQRERDLVARAAQIVVQRHLRGQAQVYNHELAPGGSGPIHWRQNDMVTVGRQLAFVVWQETYEAWGTT